LVIGFAHNLDHYSQNKDHSMAIGWDIGGVNTKVARVAGTEVLAVRSRPFEIQRDPHALIGLLRDLAAQVGAVPDDRHALTMTAELSQAFRTKREGVAFVLDAMDAAFPGGRVSVFTTDGMFLDPAQAREQPLAVAAANWMATAIVVAGHYRDALLIDTGTTTTDVIPIINGRVVAVGRTDPERLVSGELVYRGVLRTPADAMGVFVPVGTDVSRVSMEGFALAGDVFVWRGELDPSDYTVPTPDGRPPTKEFAGERLARLVCADREMLDEPAISAIADSLARSIVSDIGIGIYQALKTHASLKTAVVTGLGAFVAARAAIDNGLDVAYLSDHLGDAGARSAPATAVALLLAGQS
jgi:probable H4MPT-linked C1 transfer pathway protein